MRAADGRAASPAPKRGPAPRPLRFPLTGTAAATARPPGRGLARPAPAASTTPARCTTAGISPRTSLHFRFIPTYAAGRPEVRVCYDKNSCLMLRFETAGESHGECLVATLTGLPAGIPISLEAINRELWRR